MPGFDNDAEAGKSAHERDLAAIMRQIESQFGLSGKSEDQTDSAESEPDRDSVVRAHRLADRVASDIDALSSETRSPNVFQQVISEERYAEDVRDVPIRDVVTNVRQLAIEISVAKQFDLPIVSLPVQDQLVPVSMNAVIGETTSLLQMLEGNVEPSAIRGLLNERLFAYAEAAGLKTVSAAAAPEITRVNLRHFFTQRFWGMKLWSGLRNQFTAVDRNYVNQAVPGGGLRVEVFTQTPGLRIHVAPAYYVSNWLFLGHPTTPVSGVILPGRHVFAGDGTMLPTMVIDSGVFDTPPVFKIKLKDF